MVIMKFCINCGAKLSDDDLFCMECGTKCNDIVQEEKNEPKEDVVASSAVIEDKTIDEPIKNEKEERLRALEEERKRLEAEIEEEKRQAELERQRQEELERQRQEELERQIQEELERQRRARRGENDGENDVDPSDEIESDTDEVLNTSPNGFEEEEC
jgi:hypothetical protein